MDIPERLKAHVKKLVEQIDYETTLKVARTDSRQLSGLTLIRDFKNTDSEGQGDELFFRLVQRKAAKLGVPCQQLDVNTCTLAQIADACRVVYGNSCKGFSLVHLKSEQDVDRQYTQLTAPRRSYEALPTDQLPCVAAATVQLLYATMLMIHENRVYADCCVSATDWHPHVLIIGRGHATKGLPEALIDRDCTVTVTHSKTSPELLSVLSRSADVIVNSAQLIRDSLVSAATPYLPVTTLWLDLAGNQLAACASSTQYFSGIGPLTVSLLVSRGV